VKLAHNDLEEHPMKLRKRQKRKTAQALDALAGVTKIWTEWQIGKKAGKGVAKAGKSVAKVKKASVPSRVKKVLSSKSARLAGVGAVVAGAGAAVAKKLKGGGPEPIYTPPSPGEPVAPPDVPPPLAIAPEPATPTHATSPQGGREAAIGESALRPSSEGGAAEPEPEPTAGTMPHVAGDTQAAPWIGAGDERPAEAVTTAPGDDEQQQAAPDENADDESGQDT
jgi:hypothetical protein